MAPKRKGQDGSKAHQSLAEFLGLPPPPPPPTECPDCGSHSIVPICYGLPGPKMREVARRGEIVLGGCRLRTPRWHCRDCFNSWPEDPPSEEPHRIPERQKKHLAETAAKYASLMADAVLPCQHDEPTVVNYWERPDGRKVFVVRFPWGRMRVEKRLHLLPLGGAPVYAPVAGFPPEGADYMRACRQAALAAVRFERRPPV